MKVYSGHIKHKIKTQIKTSANTFKKKIQNKTGITAFKNVKADHDNFKNNHP